MRKEQEEKARGKRRKEGREGRDGEEVKGAVPGGSNTVHHYFLKLSSRYSSPYYTF